MSSSGLLGKPLFWILFVAAVVVALYVYGLSMVREASELERARARLSSLTESLKQAEEAHEASKADLSSKISNLEARIHGLEAQSRDVARQLVEVTQERDGMQAESSGLTQALADCRKGKEEKAAELEVCALELERSKRLTLQDARRQSDSKTQARPPESGPRNRNEEDQSQTGGSKPPQAAMPAGYGRLVVYSRCSDQGDKRVWIDGRFSGTLRGAFRMRPFDICNRRDDVVSVFVTAGDHDVLAKGAGKSFAKHIVVRERACVTLALTCP